MESPRSKCSSPHRALSTAPGSRLSVRAPSLLMIFKYELILGLDTGKDNLLKDVIYSMNLFSFSKDETFLSWFFWVLLIYFGIFYICGQIFMGM